jgi:hypothetical protein
VQADVVIGPKAMVARLAVALAALLLIAGCASTPQASPQQDALAKEFITHPNASTIYVYRSEFNHFDTDTALYLDGRLIGATLPGAYFRIDTVPGRHVLHGTGIDVGQFELNTRPGEVYFVSLDVLGAHSNFRLVPDQVGRERVRACCALLENWAPGQRPFVLR